MTSPNSQNICMLIWQEAHKRGALPDEPILEEIMINGREATLQRCVECAGSILRLKDNDGNQAFLDMPKDNPCRYTFALSLRDQYKPAASLGLMPKTADH